MAELVREYARSGAPTARIDNRYLHSRYDPVRDAARFVSNSLDHSNRPGTVIVVGATLGHLGTALATLHPEARRIALCLWDELAADTARAFHHTWSPNSGPLTTFLRALIDEVDLRALAILEWRPAMEAAPELALSVLADLRRVLDERRSSRDTVSAFGQRWLRNTCRNLTADLSELVDLGSETRSGRSHRGPALVALAGPSLEVVVERAGDRLRRLPIIAVASSALALATRDLRPLMVVATDAGSWAGLLLAHVVARLGPQTLIAAPPSARLPLPAGFRFAPIGQPSATEAELLAAVGLMPPIIPPQGTVAATAITLALELGFDPVYVAGLDLAHTGGQSHVRPHPLGSYHRVADQHLRPYAHTLFARGIEASRTHASYRSFFSDVDDRRVRQVVTDGSDRTMPRLGAVVPESISATEAKVPAFAATGWAPGPQRREAISRCLGQWSRLIHALGADGWLRALQDRRDSRLPPVAIELAVQLAGDELATVITAGIGSTPAPELTGALRQLNDRVLAGIETIRRRSVRPGPRSPVSVRGRGGQ